MLPGYSTNTISELDGIDSVENLASMGYSSLAITLDRHVLNPYRVDFEDHVTRWANMLHRCGFASVIETALDIFWTRSKSMNQRSCRRILPLVKKESISYEVPSM